MAPPGAFQRVVETNVTTPVGPPPSPTRARSGDRRRQQTVHPLAERSPCLAMRAESRSASDRIRASALDPGLLRTPDAAVRRGPRRDARPIRVEATDRFRR